MTHANAPLTPEGRRRLARLVVEEGWPVRRVAERFQVSPTHRQPVGGPVPGRPAHAGPLLPSPPQPRAAGKAR